ncbi:MAG: hypothetical protein ABR980_13035 [Ignavibacteriaceae bacterium]
MPKRAEALVIEWAKINRLELMNGKIVFMANP